MPIKRLRTILIVLIACIGMAASSPYVWRAGALRWAKHSARRTMSKLTADEIQNLNTVPTPINLPKPSLGDDQLASIRFGAYTLKVPQPDSHSTRSKVLVLDYPRFQVIVFPPFSATEFNRLAVQAHFKDAFDQQAAAYHTRWDQLDAQPDLPSLRRFLSLIAQKISRIACTEQFERPDLRGLIFAREPPKGATVVDVYVPQLQALCGLHFADRKQMSLDDIHEFLGALQFEKTK
jgi:hypothetical protein